MTTIERLKSKLKTLMHVILGVLPALLFYLVIHVRDFLLFRDPFYSVQVCLLSLN